MGTSLSSIHIFSNDIPENLNVSFRSFSPRWLTCTEDFFEKSENPFEYSYKLARTISRKTDAPVLNFGVFDDDMIYFDFFLKGKIVAKYSDDESSPNKNLYGIPALVNYTEGNKRRLSNILSCMDTDLKISMLEEFFGLSLLYYPDAPDDDPPPCRPVSDAIYRQYMIQEKALSGKAAPYAAKLISENPGKLFHHLPGEQIFKPHYFLKGYEADLTYVEDLIPIHFTGSALVEIDRETFNNIPSKPYYSHNNIVKRVDSRDFIFTDEAPAEYRGRQVTIPSGAYLFRTLPTGEFIAAGKNRLFVYDANLQIVSKLSIKGDATDIVDNFLLATSGTAFFYYGYDPASKIRIYEIIKKD